MHLVGLVIRIYHDARSHERQIWKKLTVPAKVMIKTFRTSKAEKLKYPKNLHWCKKHLEQQDNL